MRVLTVINDLGPGGTQRVAENYTLAYVRGGHSAAVLAVRDEGPRGESLKRAGVPVFSGGGDEAAAVASAVAWRPDLVHLHRAGRPDRLHTRILRELRTRLPEPHAVLETNVFGKVDYSDGRTLIDVHMPLTRWSLWKWRQWTAGLAPRPIGVVMPNLVDTRAFFPVEQGVRDRIRADLGIPSGAFVFGRVGQPIDVKWSPVAIDAFAAFARGRGDAYLLLVGLPPNLRRHIGRLPEPIRQRIVEAPFLLSDERLRACYGAMDVFLHASAIGESFGLVLAEAMLCERPVITLSTPAKDNSQLEVVGHEVGGLVVSDRRTMVVAMRRLYDDMTLRERLGHDGGAGVRARFDLDLQFPTLEKIAAIALRAGSRERLAAELAEEADLITDVTTAEIRALLADAIGRPSLKDEAVSRLIHSGRTYRTYSRLRFLLGKT